MGKPWSSKGEFGQLSSRLAESERHDFEAGVLPVLRVIWPHVIQTRSSRSHDRLGIDHLVWGDRDDELSLVVQCKGFDAKTRSLGRSQIDQCLNSIATFRESGLTTSQYVLVHNRDARDKAFREQVGAALDQLIDTGAAKEADLLDRQSLLRRAFDSMYARINEALRNESLSRVKMELEQQYPRFNPIERVPLRSRVLVVDQHHLREEVEESQEVGDPAEILNKEAEHSLALLTGTFGSGKTTAVLRATRRRAGIVLFVPARVIPETINGAKELLFLLVDQEALFASFSEEDRRTCELLARPGVEYLLKDDDLDVTIILDGLDESAFLSRRGSLQHLFNLLRPVAVPVLLTMRTEFWRSQRGEFEYSVGQTAGHGERQFQRIRALELLPWNDAEIRALIQRFEETSADRGHAERLRSLRKIVGSDQFHELYGDIPRRPLFLRLIIDSVAAEGLPEHRVALVELMMRWIRLKIHRDVLEPRRGGGLGRAPVISDAESTETAMSVAWEAMESASRFMTQRVDGVLELVSTCNLSEVLKSSWRLQKIEEPTGLILHSILEPVDSAGFGERRVKFSHRAFQEFFLAYSIWRGSFEVKDSELSKDVEKWVEAIERTFGSSEGA